MRLYRYGIQPNIGATGEATHITVWFENRDDMTGDIMNGNFIASMDDFVRIQNKEITTEDIIKQKITKMLDLNADADIEIALHEIKTQITEKDAEIERLNESLMEMVLMISNLTMPDIDIPEPEEPPIEDEPEVEEEPEEPPSEDEPEEPPIEDEPEVEEDGEIISDDSDMGIDPIDENTESEGGEGGE